MQLTYHMKTIKDLVLDHSTISQLRRRKPSVRKVFRRLFEEVVRQCIEKGLVSGRLTATDSTYVKANASRESEHLMEALEEPGVYWERLDVYDSAPYLEQLEHIHNQYGKLILCVNMVMSCTKATGGAPS